MITQERIYPFDRDVMLNAINVVIERLDAAITFSDTPRGVIEIYAELHAESWPYRFVITDRERGVKLRVESGYAVEQDYALECRNVERIFAIIDRLLIDSAPK